MGQVRFNNLMILNIYKAELDALDLTCIAREFVHCQGKKEHRYKFLVTFNYNYSYSLYCLS